MCLPTEPTDAGGHPEHVGITRKRGIPTREIGDAFEPVADGVWMNEQFAGACLDRAAGVQICVQGLGQGRAGIAQRPHDLNLQRGDRGGVAEQCPLGQ